MCHLVMCKEFQCSRIQVVFTLAVHSSVGRAGIVSWLSLLDAACESCVYYRPLELPSWEPYPRVVIWKPLEKNNSKLFLTAFKAHLHNIRES